MITPIHFQAGQSVAAPISAPRETSALVMNSFRPAEAFQAPPPLVSAVGDSGVATPAIDCPRHVDETWSNTREKAFSILALKVAKRQHTQEELAHFHQLQAFRRRTRNMRSAEEILFDFRRRQIESKLIASLHEYVDFLEAPYRQEAQDK
jgi:hypothetical protein